MDELIKKQDMINALCAGCNEDCEQVYCDYHHIFNNLPVIDAVPAKHGHYEVITLRDDTAILLCSKCRRSIRIMYKDLAEFYRTDFLFCNYCGAKMREIVE